MEHVPSIDFCVDGLDCLYGIWLQSKHSLSFWRKLEKKLWTEDRYVWKIVGEYLETFQKKNEMTDYYILVKFPLNLPSSRIFWKFSESILRKFSQF